MKIKLNIGLENNPLTETDITRILWLNGFYHIKSRTNVGTYLGRPERTLVIESEYLRTEEQFIRVVEALCLMLTQDCIAAVYNDVCALIYDPSFNAEKFEFDNELFIEL